MDRSVGSEDSVQPTVLDRRDMMRVGGAVVAMLGLAGLSGRLPAAIAAAPDLGSGMVVAWVQVALGQRTDLRLVHLVDGEMPVTIAADRRSLRDRHSLHDAVAHARQIAVQGVAARWRVAGDQCVMSDGAVVHSDSGRSIPCRIWVDIVPAASALAAA